MGDNNNNAADGTPSTSTSPILTPNSMNGKSTTTTTPPRYNIAMVSDFFYPGFGGVESHLYNLSLCLIKRGHKVIIITRSYENRSGIRWLTNGLKVYYVPIPALRLAPGTVTLSTFYSFFPLLRNILIREQIDIVHGHQCTSSMCHEAIWHARTMGISVCFTDHSLFGFADAACIHINKLMKFSLSDVDHCICVSHTSKENTVLRAAISPYQVSVIPNAVDTTIFRPSASAASKVRNPNDPITVVVLTRLVYRKGVDLLAEVIPEICARFPQVNFIIGGDGQRRLQLEEMIEKHQLYDRVEMIGAVPHSEARNLLIKGQIFLNCSLTEAFCIAILEAASCGLLVVSTKVGGVPEVLPRHMVLLAEPTTESIVNAMSEAIPLVKNVNPLKFHEELEKMYSWDNVAERTEKIYSKIRNNGKLPLIERFRRYYGAGKWYGKILCCIVAIDYLFYILLEWIYPRDQIEKAVDFPHAAYKVMQKRHRKEEN